MKILAKLTAFTVGSVLLAGPAMAGDSESYVINLEGSVESNCELVPEGSTTANVDMLETGNQGFLVVAYSCNSPYELTLSSLNGGMEHQESGGAVNIDYDIEATFGGFTTVNSVAAQASPQVIASDNDWTNILLNGGVRSGNLDLSFDSLAEYAVAGTYNDTLTITLAAVGI
jgi:hypothetical protein